VIAECARRAEDPDQPAAQPVVPGQRGAQLVGTVLRGDQPVQRQHREVRIVTAGQRRDHLGGRVVGGRAGLRVPPAESAGAEQLAGLPWIGEPEPGEAGRCAADRPHHASMTGR
jgi:hypothetical protein